MAGRAILGPANTGMAGPARGANLAAIIKSTMAGLTLPHIPIRSTYRVTVKACRRWSGPTSTVDGSSCCLVARYTGYARGSALIVKSVTLQAWLRISLRTDHLPVKVRRRCINPFGAMRLNPRRYWRSRADPFVDVWDVELVPLLKSAPKLKAITLLRKLQADCYDPR